MQTISEIEEITIQALNIQLLKKYKASPSIRLRNRIATLNHDLARFVARRESERRRLELDDLEQLAVMGLIKAIERYEPDKCSSFSSFAVPYIRGEIQHFCRDKETTIKVPRRWRERADAVRKAQADLLRQGREVSLETIALSMGMSLGEWREIQAATTNHRLISIDDEEALELVAPIAEPDNEDALTYGLRLLSTQQRKCIVERYFAQIPASVIAVRHNLPVERVNSLIAEGLEQLRAA